MWGRGGPEDRERGFRWTPVRFAVQFYNVRLKRSSWFKFNSTPTSRTSVAIFNFVQRASIAHNTFKLESEDRLWHVPVVRVAGGGP